MNLKIQFRNTPTNQDAIEYIEHRLSSRLGRFENQIESVDVTLSDVNGPKGGIDQHCLVVIKPEGLAKIVISEAQSQQKSAIDRCFSRAHMAVARQIKRKNQAIKNHAHMKRSLLRNNTHELEDATLEYKHAFRRQSS